MIEFKTFPEQPVRWFFAQHYDSEAWGGGCSSREEALAKAIEQLFDERDECVAGFWLISGSSALPDNDVPPEVIDQLLVQIEEDQCWFEDCGIDRDEAFRARDEPTGLRTFLKAAFEHWMVENVELVRGRMIEDFLTMDYYRRVRRDGRDVAELRSEIQAGEESEFEGPEMAAA